MAVPTEWQSPAQSLNEFVTVEGVQAILLTETEAPKVIVYRWTDRHAEACQLTVLDAKLSSQNLSDIVIFGESLLARR